MGWLFFNHRFGQSKLVDSCTVDSQSLVEESLHPLFVADWRSSAGVADFQDNMHSAGKVQAEWQCLSAQAVKPVHLRLAVFFQPAQLGIASSLTSGIANLCKTLVNVRNIFGDRIGRIAYIRWIPIPDERRVKVINSQQN
ncbi:MAG: hypothetical protein DIKNOCCD_00519 [bacterium]|nr:hypothetical protein [bacterium]